MGFRHSRIDSCLFLKTACAVVIYVDDMLIFSSQQVTIDSIIQTLGKKFPLTDEGDAANYLGIVLEKGNDCLELKKPGSIDKLLSLIGLESNSNPSNTPALQAPRIEKTKGNSSFDWNYASAVGLLLWISCKTRPDISYAVSAAARFMSNPKPEKYRAVIRIGRYLRGTKKRGLILRPDVNEPKFEVFVDSDFAGAYSTSQENPRTDSSLARSRTGYILCFAGAPLLWVSKLKGKIALSTIESEYIALSHSLRNALPTQQVLRELANIFKFYSPHMIMKCDVF